MDFRDLYIFCFFEGQTNGPFSPQLSIYSHFTDLIAPRHTEPEQQFPNVMSAARLPLYDRGQTLRRLLAVFSLRAHSLLRLDDDVNGPLPTSFLLLGIRGHLPLILTRLLLR